MGKGRRIRKDRVLGLSMFVVGALVVLGFYALVDLSFWVETLLVPMAVGSFVLAVIYAVGYEVGGRKRRYPHHGFRDVEKNVLLPLILGQALGMFPILIISGLFDNLTWGWRMSSITFLPLVFAALLCVAAALGAIVGLVAVHLPFFVWREWLTEEV